MFEMLNQFCFPERFNISVFTKQTVFSVVCVACEATRYGHVSLIPRLSPQRTEEPENEANMCTVK